MKDLNKNELYDLRGITQEQAEELLKWLMINDKEWHIDFISDFGKFDNFVYYQSKDITTWMFSDDDTPTTHISTLFEQSYEEQLIEAVKRVEELKRKINEPKVGDWMFMKGRGFKIVHHEKQASGLKNQGWQKVTDPFTLETLNKYGAN